MPSMPSSISEGILDAVAVEIEPDEVADLTVAAAAAGAEAEVDGQNSMHEVHDGRAAVAVEHGVAALFARCRDEARRQGRRIDLEQVGRIQREPGELVMTAHADAVLGRRRAIDLETLGVLQYNVDAVEPGFARILDAVAVEVMPDESRR